MTHDAYVYNDIPIFLTGEYNVNLNDTHFS